jgi:hypothetical protein
VAISNQFLAIPPDHPLAVELFYLLGLQGVVISQQNVQAAMVNADGDRTSYDRHEIAMRRLNEAIKTLLDEYRDERGADETCTVGLTHDARGFPVVDGHTCGPALH